MKPRLPSLPIPELRRLSYGKGFVTEDLQMLKKARQITVDNRLKANEEFKDNHDEKARPHSFKEEV